MTDRTLIFPPSSAIAFTTGEYSDYGLSGILITLKEVDLPKLTQEFVTTYEAKNDWDRAEPEGFPSWLITNSYAMAADVQEVHLGSYGRFNAEFSVKHADD